MATVYLARDLKHDRPVAIKVLRAEIAALLGPERFLREIDTVAQLNHPHILPLYDSVESAGRLFFVTPYIAGGSLGDRLARDGPLPVPEALAIARQVASGLAYAHELGVVHRDIKPGNILLAGEHAYLADFGIARAIRQAATEERLTEVGLVLGTPSYMPPEQLRSASQADGRSDEYSLACVLYEALMGAPPDSSLIWGPSGPPSLRRHRGDVPQRVDAAVRKALAVVPSDRFGTVAEFAAALDGSDAAATRSLPRRIAALVTPGRAALWAALIGLGALGAWAGAGMVRGHGSAGLDSTRYAILPMEGDSGVRDGLNADQRLHDAFARWSGLGLVDPIQLRERRASSGSGPLSIRQAARVAAGLGAGRFVRPSVSRVGDSLRIQLGLYDATGEGGFRREAVLNFPGQPARPDSLFAVLVDRLLFDDGAAAAGGIAAAGSWSFPAVSAFLAGHGAIGRWELVEADSAFAAAGRLDRRYARAHLWLALVRAWSGAEPARWGYLARQAQAERAALAPQEQRLADAVVAQAGGDLARACRQWRDLAAADSTDFAVWYGYAQCLRRDDIVLRDPRSMSGWRFRSSYHTALKAYRRAFELLPAVLGSFRQRSYEALRDLFATSRTRIHAGRALPPDTTRFWAYPSWSGDSLVYFPHPASEIEGLDPTAVGRGGDVAVQRQREEFHEVALTWATALPQSSDAFEALAVSLELLGNGSALDTLRRARRLAGDSAARLRLAGAEVWLRVRFALPNHPEALQPAAALADSLLESARPSRSPEPATLMSLAILRGRAALGAQLARQVAARSWALPAGLEQSAPAFLVYASLGGPKDSLVTLEDQVAEAIRTLLPEPERTRAEMEWLARPATLAYPETPLQSITRLHGRGDYLVDAQWSLQAGDSAAVRRALDEIGAARKQFAGGDLPLDALYPEAHLIAAAGDPSRAAAWLDPALAALPGGALRVPDDPAAAGALLRAVAFRAELAARLGDSAMARRLARAITTLWTEPDDFLRPLVSRMRLLAERQSR